MIPLPVLVARFEVDFDAGDCQTRSKGSPHKTKQTHKIAKETKIHSWRLAFVFTTVWSVIRFAHSILMMTQYVESKGQDSLLTKKTHWFQDFSVTVALSKSYRLPQFTSIDKGALFVSTTSRGKVTLQVEVSLSDKRSYCSDGLLLTFCFMYHERT